MLFSKSCKYDPPYGCRRCTFKQLIFCTQIFPACVTFFTSRFFTSLCDPNASQSCAVQNLSRKSLADPYFGRFYFQTTALFLSCFVLRLQPGSAMLLVKQVGSLVSSKATVILLRLVTISTSTDSKFSTRIKTRRFT